jgi:hypothetical protein
MGSNFSFCVNEDGSNSKVTEYQQRSMHDSLHFRYIYPSPSSSFRRSLQSPESNLSISNYPSSQKSWHEPELAELEKQNEEISSPQERISVFSVENEIDEEDNASVETSISPCKDRFKIPLLRFVLLI